MTVRRLRTGRLLSPFAADRNTGLVFQSLVLRPFNSLSTWSKWFVWRPAWAARILFDQS
jgi:hypothetical protein